MIEGVGREAGNHRLLDLPPAERMAVSTRKRI
jgi:hypothetical protein